jgi:hypothetical protein
MEVMDMIPSCERADRMVSSLMDVRELWVMRCGALRLGAAVANEKRNAGRDMKSFMLIVVWHERESERWFYVRLGLDII